VSCLHVGLSPLLSFQHIPRRLVGAGPLPPHRNIGYYGEQIGQPGTLVRIPHELRPVKRTRSGGRVAPPTKAAYWPTIFYDFVRSIAFEGSATKLTLAIGNDPPCGVDGLAAHHFTTSVAMRAACARCVHREIKENLETAKVSDVLNAHRCQRRRSTDNVVEFSKGVTQASAISTDGSRRCVDGSEAAPIGSSSSSRRFRMAFHQIIRDRVDDLIG
jgi:hypothetical protein